MKNTFILLLGLLLSQTLSSQKVGVSKTSNGKTVQASAQKQNTHVSSASKNSPNSSSSTHQVTKMNQTNIKATSASHLKTQHTSPSIDRESTKLQPAKDITLKKKIQLDEKTRKENTTDAGQLIVRDTTDLSTGANGQVIASANMNEYPDENSNSDSLPLNQSSNKIDRPVTKLVYTCDDFFRKLNRSERWQVLSQYERYDLTSVNQCNYSFPEEDQWEVTCQEFEQSSDARKAHILTNPQFYNLKGIQNCPSYLEFQSRLTQDSEK